MALTREDVLSLIRMLSEDGELRSALRQVLLAEPFVIEVRLPTDWMTKVDARLDKLDRDVGMLKGKVLEVDYRTKAASIFGLFLRNGRDASEFVSSKLDEAIDKGLIAPQEADFVMAADLLWMGNVRRGKFEGETVVFVGEASWTIEPDDIKRAEEKAQVLRKAGVWAVPFVSGGVWSPPELKSQALERKILCATDSRLEPSRADWEAFEELLAFWKP